MAFSLFVKMCKTFTEIRKTSFFRNVLFAMPLLPLCTKLLPSSRKRNQKHLSISVFANFSGQFRISINNPGPILRKRKFSPKQNFMYSKNFRVNVMLDFDISDKFCLFCINFKKSIREISAISYVFASDFRKCENKFLFQS
jgi:hypothetical protein